MNDQEHFESYRAQTQAKHEILEKYIVAYFTILKRGGANLAYIDGFAGRGKYTAEDGSEVDGSPLRALHKIASDPDLAKRVTTLFIEKDKLLYDQLVPHLEAFHQANPGIRKPKYTNGEFSSVMTELLNGIDDALAPAFVFIDPCGVDGVDFNVINRILKSQAKAEVFVFFNIDGFRRVLGLGEAMGPTAPAVLGGKERVAELEIALRESKPADKEKTIIGFYEDLLRSHTPAKYVVSFRVEKEARRVTGHYLIHASQHPLGFRIMKEVMWGVGRSDGAQGGLAFEQASVTGMDLLFGPDTSAIKQEILNELGSGPKLAKYFYETLSERANNRLCAKAYRPALLELEKQGKVIVLKGDCTTPAPDRRKPKGVLTLGENYYIKLR